MTDKIVFYQDYSIQYFGLAKSLQELYDCKLYAVFDVTNNTYKFFEKQNIVKYEKTWFLYDYVKSDEEKPDLKYISEFEESYGIELWKLALNDRFFYNYNPFYKFSPDQVLKIIEQESKIFEKILDEIKPDFVILNLTNNFKNHLFYEICKSKKIHVLMMISGRIGNRLIISEDANSIDYLHSKIYDNKNPKSLEELRIILNNKRMYNYTINFTQNFLKSKIHALKAGLRFILFSNNNLKTHYTYFGRKKINVIIYTIKMSIKKRIRYYFINKTFLRKIENDNFIIFPLIVEPERSLLIDAPFFTNLLELITNFSKSLPIGYTLYVKEHPGMDTRDWRNISFYRKIMQLPNTCLIHPTVDPNELLEKCSLVLTIGSTIGFEAAFYGKNTITLTKTIYSNLKSVSVLENINDLPKLIRQSLNKPIDPNDLSAFYDILEENSFDALNELGDFTNRYLREFFYNGFLSDVEINESKMKLLLEDHEGLFKILANEHLKKIEEHKYYDKISTSRS